LVDSTFHFVAPVCDYLRNLVLHEQLKTSSAKTYAEYIQQFWNFLEKDDIAFSEVTDTELLTWLNQQKNRGNKDYVVAARCDAIFDMYCWLQIKGYVEDMVRIPNHNDDVVFEPMLSSKTARPSRFRPSRYGVVSAIRPNGSDADSIQPTPNSDELSKLYIVADNPDNFDLTERNQLLIDWYGQTGVRRLEVQNLTVDQIPDWSTIDKLRAYGHAYEMRITETKGDKPRHIGVLPHLLERTREWIEGGRANIVNRFKRKDSAYLEPKEIFISNKTGEAISLKAITNLFTSFFRKANVDGHGHRIRAYYLNNLLQAEVDAAMATLTSNGGTSASIDWELIIRKVAERAGHQNLDTLRKYVTILKKKYHRISGRDDLVTVDQLLKTKKQQLDLIDHQISQKKAELAALLVDKKNNE
jgi:site-specific recombinase XerD